MREQWVSHDRNSREQKQDDDGGRVQDAGAVAGDAGGGSKDIAGRMQLPR